MSSFVAQIYNAFAYPLQSQGLVLLGMYFVFHVAINLLKYLPFAGNFILFPFLGLNLYFTSIVIGVVTETSEGKDDFPEMPDLTDWREDILQPALLILVATLLCFGPVIGYNFYNPAAVNPAAGPPRYPLWLWVYFFIAIFYYPMGLLAVIRHDSLLALNPYLVIKSILKIRLAYFSAWLGMMLVLTLILSLATLPYGRYLTKYGVDFYLIVIEARLLGLLYYQNRDVIGWA